MLIVGVDPGLTRTGAVLYQEQKFIGAATFKADDTAPSDGQRAMCLAQQIYTWVEDQYIDMYECGEIGATEEVVLAIEVPIMGRHVQNYAKQMRVLQAIVSEFQKFVEYVVEVGPTQLKRLAADNGSASKDEIVAACPLDLTSLDKIDREAIADAWGATQAVDALVDGPIRYMLDSTDSSCTHGAVAELEGD